MVKEEEVSGIKQEIKKTIPQQTAPTKTYQPRIQTPTRGFFNRGVRSGIGGIERGSARLGRRVGLGIGRLGTRLFTQAGMAAGRAVVGALVSNPIGWAVIGVIVAIIIIVFLIIMFAGGGGFGGSAPTVDCADADGNPIVVFDGNECAVNTAAYYSKLTGTSITTACLDKCTDTVSVICDRNSINTCTSPDASCGTMETFCIQYSPPPPPSAAWLYDCNSAVFDYTFFASCSGSGIITPTP